MWLFKQVYNTEVEINLIASLRVHLFLKKLSLHLRHELHVIICTNANILQSPLLTSPINRSTKASFYHVQIFISSLTNFYLIIQILFTLNGRKKIFVTFLFYWHLIRPCSKKLSFCTLEKRIFCWQPTLKCVSSKYKKIPTIVYYCAVCLIICIKMIKICSHYTNWSLTVLSYTRQDRNRTKKIKFAK